MITLLLIAATVMISITSMDNYSLKNKLMFNAYMIKHRKEWYRFFSNGLIHADWFHLGFNMFALYMFGRSVEQGYISVFGNKGNLFYMLLYIGGLAMSSIYSYEKHKDNIHYNALGASGAVAAIIFANIIINPTDSIGLIFLPVEIPGYLFGIIYLAAEYYMGKKGKSNIGHDAHFWGAIFGIVFTIILKPSLINSFIDQLRN